MTAPDPTAGTGAAPSNPGTRRRFDVHVTRAAAIAAVAVYLLHLAFIYMLTQQVHGLERNNAVLELEIARLRKKLEILNVVEHHQSGFSSDEIAQITDVIDSESRRYGIDPLLVLAVILTESEFKRFQVSDSGALGLMQIRPYVGRDLALRSGIAWNESMGLHDPALNVRLGTTYLFELVLKFKDITHALAAYGHGETALRHRLALGRAAPKNYARRVMNRYEKLVAEFRNGGSG
jgi:soluble lytic murein transglycosylase-like protein